MIAGNLDAGALGSLAVTGVVTSRSIALASANITIGSAGRIGTAGVTQQLSIANNNSDNQTFVGGAAGTSVAGYHIDAEEDRKSVVEGKSVSGRVDLGGRRIIKKKKKVNKDTALKKNK